MNPKDHSIESLLVAPQAVTHGATVTANYDTAIAGGSYATIRIALASELSTSGTGPTISLLESDDTVVTNFATVIADRSAEDLTAAKVLTYHVDLRGRKRYLRLSVTPPSGSTNSNITFGATGTISHIGHGGTSTTDNVVV